MKYDINVIKNYVLGEDVSPYEIDDLENDPNFMMEVIKYSKDKKMYELCSDAVKKDYLFTRFLIDFFSKDESFCEYAAETFLSLTNPESIESREMCIVMAEKFEGKLDVFSIRALTFYTEEMNNIDIAVSELEESKEDLGPLGMGFIIVKNEYPGSEAIQSYFAKKLIEEIFFHSEGNLIDFCHNHFPSFEAMEKGGLNNSLINIIMTRDPELARYVGTHIDVLNPLKKELEEVKRTWKFDETKKYTDRVESFLDELERYMEPLVGQIRLSEEDVFSYVVKKLGIEKIIDQYDYTRGIRIEYDKEKHIPVDFVNKEIIDSEHALTTYDMIKDDLTLTEMRCLRDMLDSGRRTFIDGLLYDEYEIKEEQDKPAEIIVIPFSKKK